MNWWIIFWNALYACGQRLRRLLLPHRHRAQRARRLHRPAQLRPGRLRRGRAPTPSPSRSPTTGGTGTSPCRSSLLVLGPARPAARAADPAAARRLPGHRHDRGQRDHPLRRATRRASRGSPAAATARTAGRSSSRTSTRSRNDAVYHLGKQPIDGYHLFMMIVGWGLVAVFALLVWALMRSPWGRVLKSIREDENAARALGKNVLCVQDAEPHPRRPDRVDRRMMLAAQTAFGPTRAVRHDADVLRLHGGGARRRRAGEGPDRRHDHLLLRASSSSTTCSARRHGSDVCPSGSSRRTTSARSRTSSSGAALALLVVFRPQGIFGDRREQVFDVR